MKSTLRQFLHKPAGVLLLLLLTGDLFFFAFHLLAAFSPAPKALVVGSLTIAAPKSLFFLSADRGFAEFYQYVKLLWVAVLLFMLALDRRQPRLLAWSLLFAYLLVDDFAGIHEALGLTLAGVLDLPSILVLEPKYVGQLVYAAVLGTVLLLVFIVSRSGDPELDRFVKVLLFLLVALGVAGVGFDALNDLVDLVAPQALFNLLEDGGEMLVVSVIVWWVYARVVWYNNYQPISSN